MAIPSSIKLPANSRFAVARATAAPYGTIALEVVGSKAATSATSRKVAVQALAANEYYVVDFLERGATVTVKNGFKLYLDSGDSKWRLIAQA